jgi:radical SAM protein with 4Fe4S-binding SPASM domain
LKLLPFYKEKLENGKILITNWSGGWLILDEKQFNEIISKEKEEIDDSLLFLLEEEGFIKPKDLFVKERFKHLAVGTSLHIVSLAKDCNLNCNYCFMNATNNKGLLMNKETAKKVVDFIFQSPSKAIEIHFTGGEPLLNFEIMKFIVNYSKEKNKEKKKKLSFSITTNLTILNKEIIELFKKENFSVTVSIDGPKEIHEANRGKNFDLIMKNIKKLRENNIETHFLPVITKLSLKKWKEIVDFFVFELNYNLIHWKYMYKTGRAALNWNKIGYSAEEFVDSWKKVINYLIKLNEEGINAKERIASVLLTKILKRKEANLTCLMNPCGAISLQLSYDYDGSIYTCDEGKGIEELKLGNVFNDNYYSIRRKPLAKEMVSLTSNLDYSCKYCAFNSWCGTCVVENLAWENNYYSHVPSSFRHKVLYEQFKFLFKLIDEKPEIMQKWTF